MNDADTPLIRSNDGKRPGIAERGDTEIVLANRLLAVLSGKSLVQFRLGYAVHLELGTDHEITIETPFEIVDGNARWGGEPLTADAAGALLPLNLRDVTTSYVAPDCTLVLGLGSATLTVPPHPLYEAWQVRGTDGLLIVCSPGGDYLAVWEPESRS